MKTNIKMIIVSFVIGMLSACASTGNQIAYKSFGEKAGIKKVVDDLFVLIDKDVRIAAFFAETDNEYIKEQLTEQFCEQLNGPCEYSGVSMTDSHSGLKIKREHFNALVELLRESMDKNNVPFSAQNKLLSRLAPMNKEIVE